VTTPSYSDTGLAGSTTYYYVVEAVDADGTSAASGQASATTPVAPVCTTVPSAPAGLTATASSSSVIGLSWNAVTPPTNCSISSYSVYGGTTANPTTLIAGGLTGTTYSNTGLSASTTYYYVVKAIDADGTSAASTQATATTPASSGISIVSINAGGPAESNSSGGDNPFVADEDFSTGGTTYAVTNAITIPAGVAAAAAPAAVYQSARQGTVTYTIPGLNSGSSYTVRLHFAELYFSAAGDRVFNVAINGTTVLSNFDIFAAATANFTAVVEQFTATANSSGDIVIAFTNGTKDQPMINGVEVLGSSTNCSATPAAPTGLAATASSYSAIGLSWSAVTPPANCTISSYSVYGGTTTNPTTLIAGGVTGTTFSNTGLAASTTYYYVVKAVDGDGTSAASAQAQATTPAAPSCTSVPPTGPTNLTATASSSSVIGLNWTAAPANPPCTITSYSVYRSTINGFTASPSNLDVSGVTGTSFSDTGLAASTTYYYVVEALDSFGASAASNQATATTPPGSSGASIVSINAGGPAESNSSGGDNSFVADEYFSTGGTTYAVTNTITIPASAATTAAPAAVYQSARQGTVTYTIPSLNSGASYTVRLHFAELYFSAAGNRVFNVAINGTTVLSNFDIFAAANANFTAVVEQFSVTADSSGDIVIAFTNGTKDQPMINGVEILGSPTACTTVPSAPTGLTATVSSSSAIGLSWNTVTPPANCTISSYSVYGGTTANPTALIASGVTGTTYSNTGLAASTTYYYVVKAVDTDGSSAASTQATATTQPVSGGEILAIACGGPAESNSGGGDYSFVADEDFVGGGNNAPVTSTINLTQPGANAAPMGVYQHARAGLSTYTIPGLTPGTQYTVLLHFAETYFTAKGDREFNVAINGNTVLTNLDIYGTVGVNAALLESFTATANSSGQIVIAFTAGAANQPVVSGIEIR
jgi:fibronectin type 3 domain-containing protein